jgi:hypothetical protein
MPRADDPRVVVRMSPSGYALVKAVADRVGVSVGGLMRECAERHAASVARQVEAGEIVLRRNSVPGPEAATGVGVAPVLSRPGSGCS